MCQVKSLKAANLQRELCDESTCRSPFLHGQGEASEPSMKFVFPLRGSQNLYAACGPLIPKGPTGREDTCHPKNIQES